MFSRFMYCVSVVHPRRFGVGVAQTTPSLFEQSSTDMHNTDQNSRSEAFGLIPVIPYCEIEAEMLCVLARHVSSLVIFRWAARHNVKRVCEHTSLITHLTAVDSSVAPYMVTTTAVRTEPLSCRAVTMQSRFCLYFLGSDHACTWGPIAQGERANRGAYALIANH